MHTRAIACGVALIGALVLAAPAGADRPLKEPAPPLNETFPAGVVCPFQVTIETLVNNGFTISFVDKDGNFRWQLGAGHLVVGITNDETGASLVLNTTGPGKLFDNGDGTLTIVGGGHWTLLTFPGDVPPSTILYTSGRIEFTVDLATGRLVLVSLQGTSQDLCEALEG